MSAPAVRTKVLPQSAIAWAALQARMEACEQMLAKLTMTLLQGGAPQDLQVSFQQVIDAREAWNELPDLVVASHVPSVPLVSGRKTGP